MIAQAQTTPPAQPSFQWPDVRDHWGAGDLMPVAELMVWVGLVLVVIAGAGVWVWWRRRHTLPEPMAAFNRVAVACGLGWGDRWLLVRVARKQGLPSPLTLLACPATMRKHGAAWARGTGAGAAGLRRVATLRRRLFGNLR